MDAHNNKDNVLNIRELFSIAHTRLIFFILPALIVMTAACFEGVSVTLMMPLAKGILLRKFDFILTHPIAQKVVELFHGHLGGPDSTLFILLMTVVFLSSLLKNILQYIAAMATAYQIRKFTDNLRKAVFERFLKFGKMFFDKTNKGYLQNTLVNYTQQIGQQMMALHRIIFATLTLLVYFYVLLFISWKLSLFTIFVLPLLYISMQWLIEKIKKSSHQRIHAYNDIILKISNILSCIPLVRLYNAEEKEKMEFAGLSVAIKNTDLSIDKKDLLMEPAQDVIILIIILLLVSASAWIIVKENILDISKFFVFFYITKKCASSISTINYAKGGLAVIIGPLRCVDEIFRDSDKYLITNGVTEFRGLEHGIQVRSLNFSYRKGVSVLNNVSLEIRKNEMTALVGPTGAGKTTIINLILRFYDAPEDAILFDGIDISNFTINSLMARMALVSQDVLLFNDTIKNNLIYGLDRKITENELLDAIKKARLIDFVTALPEKFNTYIGDQGIQLSGGEKQRLSIARALLKNSEILILDEATSALDSKTERLIQEAIDEVIKDKTVIVIAHRLSTVKHADKIVAIENGRVIEEGNLETLLAKKGRFYEYWEEQKFY